MLFLWKEKFIYFQYLNGFQNHNNYFPVISYLFRCKGVTLVSFEHFCVLFIYSFYAFFRYFLGLFKLKYTFFFCLFSRHCRGGTTLSRRQVLL